MAVQIFQKNQVATLQQRFGSDKAKREYAFFMQKINGDQKLQKCTPQSLFSCALQVADMGLSFNPTANFVYIIPYGQQAQLQVSYIGLLYLIRKANPDIFIRQAAEQVQYL